MFQAETWGGSNYNFNFYWHSTSAILYAGQKKMLPLYYAEKTNFNEKLQYGLQSFLWYS